MPQDGQEGDLFGKSVAIYGDRVIVGAQKQVDSVDPGSAYIFDRNQSGTNWTQSKKLTPSDATAGDLFGDAVDIWSNQVIVGARKGNVFAGSVPGAAYIFQRGAKNSQWNEVAKLSASDEQPQDWFGWSVGISSDLAIVGARSQNAGTGAAYIFGQQESGWTEVAKLTASDAAPSSFFGFAVDLSGELAIVGANGAGPNTGAAYIFQRSDDGWTETAKLIGREPLDEDPFGLADSFGFSVSVFGDRAIVGAFGDDDNGVDSGAAYIFERSDDGWTEMAKLSPGDVQAGDLFGWSVGIWDNRAVVGSRRNDGDIGAAYVFDLLEPGWTEVAKLRASDSAMDQFGISVGLDSSDVIVGAWRDDDKGESSGSAYVYSVPEPSGFVLAAIAVLSMLLGARNNRARSEL